mgnify:CR=1 FL=1
MTELGDRETAASRLNLAQSFNGLGCICGPLVGGLLLFSEKGEANISYPYMLMGVVVLIVALVFSRIKLPEIVHTDNVVNGKTVKKGLWSHKLFLFGLLALFSYEIAEISINSFFINYVVDDGWMNARDAAVVLSFGGLGLFMCGRFAGSWIMQRIRAERVLLYCAFGNGSGYFSYRLQFRKNFISCFVFGICVRSHHVSHYFCYIFERVGK